MLCHTSEIATNTYNENKIQGLHILLPIAYELNRHTIMEPQMYLLLLPTNLYNLKCIFHQKTSMNLIR